MTPLDLMKLVQMSGLSQRDQLSALAALADAPPEDYNPSIRLPIQNELPSYKLGDGGLGSLISGQNYGVAAPMIGQEAAAAPSIGQLLIGE